MINNNNINTQQPSSSGQTTAISINSWLDRSIQILSGISYNPNNKTVNPDIKNIPDYQINKLTEKEIFSKMKLGIPSILDFLTLCRADNQQLAAEQLDNILKSAKYTDIFNWEINLISEDDCELPHNDDCLGTPLALAAKYGNTAICKILIEKMQYKLSSPIQILFYFYGTVLTDKYNRMKIEVADNCYKSFKKAIQYNNFEIAEDIYTAYETNAFSKDFVTQTLMDIIINIKKVSQLHFLLQKIDFSNKYALVFLPFRLLELAIASIEANNIEIVSYIVTKHIDIIKNSSDISIKRFLHKLLINKQFDLALVVIRNISNKKDFFGIDKIFNDNTFLEVIAKDCDTETSEWLNSVINSD